MNNCEKVNHKAFTAVTTLLAGYKNLQPNLVFAIRIKPELRKQPTASQCPFYPPISVEDEITRIFSTLGNCQYLIYISLWDGRICELMGRFVMKKESVWAMSFFRCSYRYFCFQTLKLNTSTCKIQYQKFDFVYLLKLFQIRI